MGIVALLEITVFLLMIFLSFENLSYGVCLFLIVRILVPENVRLPFVNISLNTGLIATLFVMTILKSCIKDERLKYNRSFVKCILGFCIYCLISLFLSNYSDFAIQMGYFVQFLITDIMPCVIAVSVLKSEKDILLVIKTFLITCIITTSYGVISYFLHSNPYLLLWGMEVPDINQIFWFGNFTTSTFVSTNSFGYFIGLSFPFVSFLLSKGIYKKYSAVVLILLAVCSLMGKKRTTIVVLLFYMFIWFLNGNIKRKLRYLFYVIPIVIIVIIIIFTVPSFESIRNVIVTSVFFWNDSMYNSVTLGNGGSDWALRLRQLTYPFVEIESNPIFGHGVGWCSGYLSRGVRHPLLFGFETLPAQAICEFGLASFVLYPVLFVWLYKFANVKKKDKYILLFMLTSIMQMFGTGANYWYLELLFVLLMRLVNEKTWRKNATTHIYNYARI